MMDEQTEILEDECRKKCLAAAVSAIGSTNDADDPAFKRRLIKAFTAVSAISKSTPGAYIYVDVHNIVASALVGVQMGVTAEEIHPYCEAATPWLCFANVCCMLNHAEAISALDDEDGFGMFGADDGPVIEQIRGEPEP